MIWADIKGSRGWRWYAVAARQRVQAYAAGDRKIQISQGLAHRIRDPTRRAQLAHPGVESAAVTIGKEPTQCPHGMEQDHQDGIMGVLRGAVEGESQPGHDRISVRTSHERVATQRDTDDPSAAVFDGPGLHQGRDGGIAQSPAPIPEVLGGATAGDCLLGHHGIAAMQDLRPDVAVASGRGEL